MNGEGTQSHCDLGDGECDQWGMRNVQVWSKEQPVPFAYLTSRPLLASVPLPNHPATVCDQTFTSFSAWKVFTYNWFCFVFSSTPLKYKLHESRDLDSLAHNYISGIKYPPVKTHHQWIAALPPPIRGQVTHSADPLKEALLKCEPPKPLSVKAYAHFFHGRNQNVKLSSVFVFTDLLSASSNECKLCHSLSP